MKSADAAGRRGDFTKAVKEYKSALGIKPNSVAANLGLGNAYYELDKNQDALTHLEKAKSLAPRDAQVYVLLGAVYQSAGRKNDAVDAYKRYLELAPNGKFAKEVDGILKGLGVNRLMTIEEGNDPSGFVALTRPPSRPTTLAGTPRGGNSGATH